MRWGRTNMSTILMKLLTILHEGLPPGPIGNPGMKSIYAVLDAPETSYLYFVADKEGHNYFAVTYEEHMDNVHKYMP